jgi:hypothetical protein
MLRRRLLSEMPPEQREIYIRQNLDVVRRYFNNRAVESFAKGKKKLMEKELAKILVEEKNRSKKLLLEELERQQKDLEEQVKFLRKKLERQGY